MEDISDSELWSRIVMFGEAARKWRQKFLGLLPEVARRELWKRHGFESVFVFAFKVGGVSEKQVRMVLGLEQRFLETPRLHSLLVEGVVSVNKLARVASIATVENQEMLANQVQLLSQSAVETFVRDVRSESPVLRAQKVESENKTLECQEFELTSELVERLNNLQRKGVDVDELLTEFLDKREDEIAQVKTDLGEVSGSSNRYIPVGVRRIIAKEYGTKCAIPHCSKPSNEIHHTARFSMIRNHNPNFLAPLCRQHHEIAHSVDVKYQECRK